MSLDQTVNELRNEIAAIYFALFISASIVLAVLILLNLITVFGISRYEKVFEDMLGSRDKLPDLTKLVIGYGRLAYGYMPVAILVSFGLIAWSLMMQWRRGCGFLWVAIVAVTLLSLHLYVVKQALQLPLVQIIQSISGP